MPIKLTRKVNYHTEAFPGRRTVCSFLFAGLVSLLSVDVMYKPLFKYLAVILLNRNLFQIEVLPLGGDEGGS